MSAKPKKDTSGTVEMVATFRLGPDPFGRGKLTLFYGKDNYVWLENLPGFVEAAQAVAPPKETADTKRLEELQRRYIGANFRYDFDDVTQGCAIIIQIPPTARVCGDLRKDVDELLALSSPAAPATPLLTAP